MPNLAIKDWTVPRMWAGCTAFIIGGGSSLNSTGLEWSKVTSQQILDKINLDLKSIRDKRKTNLSSARAIGVNDAFLLGDWVDVCWFGDTRWYDWNRPKLLDFPNIKACCCPALGKPPRPGIKVLKRINVPGLTRDAQSVSWNRSSGSSAISLAVHFGVKRIVLLGFDMDTKRGAHNWHSNHKVKGHSPTSPYSRFLKPFDAIAKDAKDMGVEIVNCNMDSKITQFPKMPLTEAVC